MLMTDGEIREALETGKMAIGNYDESRLEPCSYDARLGRQALVSRDYALVDLESVHSVTLYPGEFALVITEESFRLPLDMAGHIGMKSGLARRGLNLLAGLQIDPGFDGHLRLGFYNASGRPITLDYLDPICMIEFHHLARQATRSVGPFPDLQQGVIPESDKAYLRDLESSSLSEIQSELRTLTRNVVTLTAVTYRLILPLLVAIVVGGVVAFLVK